jgi:hypothetical protein
MTRRRPDAPGPARPAHAEPAGAPSAAPEFSRPVRVSALPDEGLAFNETATEEERAALARRYGARAVSRLTTKGRIERQEGGWRLSGVASARLTLTCVVTLEPVEQIIEERFGRLHLPGAPEPDLLDLDPEAEDPPEPLGESLDPGEAAAEAVALAIDPYPRADGAVFKGRIVAPDGAEPLSEAASRPFAGLAALRARMGGDRSDDQSDDGSGSGSGETKGDA